MVFPNHKSDKFPKDFNELLLSFLQLPVVSCLVVDVVHVKLESIFNDQGHSFT